MTEVALTSKAMVMAATGIPEHGRRNPQPISRTPGSATQLKDKKSLDYVLRSGLAGGIAGCAAKTLIAPLDRVKILFQASNPQFLKYTGSCFGVVNAVKHIQQNEGAFGLYRGHSATLLRIFPYAAIKFVAYEQIRAVLIRSKEQETPFRRFTSGSLAGVTSVFFTYPLEVIRVRLAFETKRDNKSGLLDICKRIHSEGGHSTTSGPTLSHVPKPFAGLSNFYRGFFPTLLGMLPYAGVSFLTHDMMGDWLRSTKLAKYTTVSHPATPTGDKGYESKRKIPLKVWAELLAGGSAGLCSQTASYPLEVIRRRMQVGGAVGDGKFLRMRETTRTIYETSGIRGFFVGLSIGYVKIIPMTACAFFVYERCKLYLGI
ncbi:mitochondrial carrier domain-containing protein [Terfezia claveryi]|nr:mitochondrial carrier domain-containing protein [Terfezia claveryi]